LNSCATDLNVISIPWIAAYFLASIGSYSTDEGGLISKVFKHSSIFHFIN